MFAHSRLCLVIGCFTVLLCSMPAVAAQPGAVARTYATDSRFQEAVTVRVAGMTLGEFLPRLGDTVGVPLRVSDPIAEQKVAVFAEEQPSGELLDALTTMLNMAPEGGYSWQETRVGTMRGYRLLQSARAREEARQRAAQEQAEALDRLLHSLALVRLDPARRLQANDAAADGTFRRATYLVSLLSEAQIARLLRDGSLVLRARELPEHQGRILHLMADDLVQHLEPDLRENQPLALAMVQNLNPADFVLTLQVRPSGTALTFTGTLRSGPGRPGIGVPIQLHETPPDEEGAGAPNADDGPPLGLNPRSWRMADVLSDLARRSGTPLVADCYWLQWYELLAAKDLSLTAFLAAADEIVGVRSATSGRFLLLRDRDPYARQSQELPRELMAAWSARIQREGWATLDLLAELPRLQPAQLIGLEQDPELRSAAGQALFLSLYASAIVLRHPLSLYANLNPLQRRQVHSSGLTLMYSELNPSQSRAFVSWLGIHDPYIGDAEYERTSLELKVTPDRVLEVGWGLSGERKTRRFHLDFTRGDWNGDPHRTASDPAEQVGMPGPPVEVVDREGMPRVLKPASGRPLVLFFRDRWAVPEIAPGAGGADLALLSDVLAGRPDLRERIAVIVPDADAAGLRGWAVDPALPVYADPDGKTAESYGAVPPPRVVLIDREGRIARTVTGTENILKISWLRWLE
jgi:hypothetical protein